MPERLECEVIQKARYINTLTFTFTFTHEDLFLEAREYKLSLVSAKD